MKEFEKWIEGKTLEELKSFEKILTREITRKMKSPSTETAMTTYTDGASRGNPGLAGAGVLLFNSKDEKLLEDFQFLGTCTNNEAEYRALILALEQAKRLSASSVSCFLDSQLTVRHLNGEYALKAEKLRPFYEKVKELTRQFRQVTFTHVPREHPKLQMADKLANKAIDMALKR